MNKELIFKNWRKGDATLIAEKIKEMYGIDIEKRSVNYWKSGSVVSSLEPLYLKAAERVHQERATAARQRA